MPGRHKEKFIVEKGSASMNVFHIWGSTSAKKKKTERKTENFPELYFVYMCYICEKKRQHERSHRNVNLLQYSMLLFDRRNWLRYGPEKFIQRKYRSNMKIGDIYRPLLYFRRNGIAENCLCRISIFFIGQ